MHKFREDLTGQKYGRLTVLRFDHFDARNKGYWLCRCDCGKVKAVETHQLKSGHTKSCGCLKMNRPVLEHGHTDKAKAVYIKYGTR